MSIAIFITLAISLITEIFSISIAHRIFHRREVTGKIFELSKIIKNGALTYLNQQFLAILASSIILAIISGLFFGLFTALTFSLGAFLSAISAYLGTLIAVNTNSKTAESAKKGFRNAFSMAFNGGITIGLLLTSLGLLIVSGLYFLFLFLGYEDPVNLVGLGFGASLVGLFARVGGGIYTKAADISADLVGKVEFGFVEDDPRNPAVIADQVGDNVGDIAGTGSDVFQSYVCTLIAAMILGMSVGGFEGVTYPLLVLSIGLVSSLIGLIFTKTVKDRNIERSIYLGMYISSFITALISGVISQLLFERLNTFYAVLSGIVAILLLAHLTEYYTSPKKRIVRNIVTASKSGPAINILTGLSIGLEATVLPILILSLAVLVSYWFEGLYGITLVAIGFLSIMATFVSMSAYGPIVDNANGLITMSNLNSEIRGTMDMLDSIGNMTKAICKVYAIGTSALAQIALFSAYLNATHLNSINIVNPVTTIGALIGGTLSFFLCSLVIKAVSKAANVMIREIHKWIDDDDSKRRKNRDKLGYARCINISTRAALKNMFYPAILSVIAPFITGLLLGPEAVGGLILGNLVTTLPLSLFMCISGAAWDNAKKYIEINERGGRGSPIHTALVIGDTVGDPLKDAAGPSLDIFINLIGTAALTYATHII
ncbi:MAG: sodium-translocating pyrophosphatase [Candidatus Bathyarchaeia archaeon]